MIRAAAVGTGHENTLGRLSDRALADWFDGSRADILAAGLRYFLAGTFSPENNVPHVDDGGPPLDERPIIRSDGTIGPSIKETNALRENFRPTPEQAAIPRGPAEPEHSSAISISEHEAF